MIEKNIYFTMIFKGMCYHLHIYIYIYIYKQNIAEFTNTSEYITSTNCFRKNIFERVKKLKVKVSGQRSLLNTEYKKKFLMIE